MGDLFQTGADWLSAMRRTHCSQLVTIRRGNQSTLDVPATQGPLQVEVDGEVDVTMVTQGRDWLISVSDYVIGGVPVEPARGDVIVTADGQEFTALPVLEESVFRVVAQGNDYRIHTKRTA